MSACVCVCVITRVTEQLCMCACVCVHMCARTCVCVCLVHKEGHQVQHEQNKWMCVNERQREYEMLEEE